MTPEERISALSDALANAEAERDYHRARADVLLAKVSGGVALRGRKPGDYWAEWHVKHCAAAEAASVREAQLSRVEGVLDEWEAWAVPRVLDLNAERRSVAKAMVRWVADLRAVLGGGS